MVKKTLYAYVSLIVTNKIVKGKTKKLNFLSQIYGFYNNAMQPKQCETLNLNLRRSKCLLTIFNQINIATIPKKSLLLLPLLLLGHWMGAAAINCTKSPLLLFLSPSLYESGYPLTAKFVRSVKITEYFKLYLCSCICVLQT